MRAFRRMNLRILSFLLVGLPFISPCFAADSPMAVPPMLRFTSPTSATVVWESMLPGKGALAYGLTPKLGTVVEAESDGMVHRAHLTGLQHGKAYHYRVATTIDGKRHLSPAYEFTNVLNFSVPIVKIESASSNAQAILKETGIRKGYAMVLHPAEVNFLAELAAHSELQIVAVLDDLNKISSLRQALYAKQLYGPRITVMEVTDRTALPITACSVNLIIADKPDEALTKYLAPGTGTLYTPNKVVVRPPLEGIGEWTHQYGDAANTANSGESLSGAKSTNDLTVQWLGHPGGDFGIDRNPRMPAPVAANGRLFHQGHNRVVALDAYNGHVLWSLEIPDLRRVNIPRDSSNWCVSADKLFMAVKNRAWIHDAATGDRIATLPVPPSAQGPHSWGYIAQAGGKVFGSGVRPEAIYERYWGGEAWYDAKAGGLGTAKVCSDQVFAYEVASRQLAWTYEKGVILNPTIAVGQGKVVFIESRHDSITSNKARQINAKELWLDQYLVALDAETGRVVFEQPIDHADGTISCYLQITPQGILITNSNDKFYLYSHHLETGELQWDNNSAWPDDHHSGHIQHPVVVNDKIFLQPKGYDLKTGAVVTSNVGQRSGCHTYVGASDCLIYRGEDRQIAVWDQKAETVTSWKRLRPSCWLSVVPSNGMLLVPEGGAGCSCGGWMETSLVFAPKTVLGYKKGEAK